MRHFSWRLPCAVAYVLKNDRCNSAGLDQRYSFLERADARRAITLCMEAAGYTLTSLNDLCAADFASNIAVCYRPRKLDMAMADGI